MSASDLTLILGGARSGKSALAERLVTALPAPWTYIATAQTWDEEMRQRVRHHRESRVPGWITVEEPLDLPGALRAADEAGHPVLVDCLTLWLTNLILREGDVDADSAALLAVLPTLHVPVILVSNEVGLGIVPDNRLSREFRDRAGRLHQDIARIAGRVLFVAAGLPLTLKGVPVHG